MGMIEEQSQADYNAALAARIAAGETCDADLSPEEKAERKEFDESRAAVYTGQWPARQVT